MILIWVPTVIVMVVRKKKIANVEARENMRLKEIDKDAADKILVELRRFGISRSTFFPDLDGLGIELGMRLSHP